ncbi:MAG TPA: GNAT family N-acetyltransferase [Stellaceae bacterium]|jgi:GNAT superfamily N-acetyltransferase|nr:GNAT family N-acetyltransferase [Stellaceae bacterium]
MAEITLRFATAEDAGVLLALVRELAIFENAPDAVLATEADLRRHGFGPEPRFEALLAFVDGRAAGFALFFPNFSTWLGKPGLFLEDIFVSEWARKLGVGRRLMAKLAAIAVERGWGRLDFSVLHWNPARGFYHRLGIRHMEEWLPYRAEGDVLAALAREDGSR